MSPMCNNTRRLCVLTVGLAALAQMPARAQEERPVRGVLLSEQHATAARLAEVKALGANAVVVMLDESVTRSAWTALADRSRATGLDLYAWVEVARNAAMADAHPEWMATPGGHHDDWKRLFPNAPTAHEGEVIKTWPWVPIGYTPAFEAHQERLRKLLHDLPGQWAGVFLNDLQAAPSSCGCGNNQCRWALDYGAPSTSPLTPGEDHAARFVADVERKLPGKRVIPVWVTECEEIDLPGTKGGTGLCGQVGCYKGDCWHRYKRAWDPLVESTKGPVALAVWSESFQRDGEAWPATAVKLFQSPPRGGAPLPPSRTILVAQAWNHNSSDWKPLVSRVQSLSAAWVLALDPIDQSWQPRVVPLKAAAPKNP
ncbi:MAG TPA: hypothetical protein VGY53_07635 [Isosphaeraceae bacterium]|nr:hypothetical protein [Isosphaeraceae bacterium]